MPYALRLNFGYEEGRWTLRSARRVQMRVPPESRVQRFEDAAGAWIELRDAGGKPLYRRVISRSVLSNDVEVRTSDPKRRLVHRAGARQTGSLQVVVPELPGAHELALLERRLIRAEGQKPRLDIIEHARVDLSKLNLGKGAQS